MRNLSTVGTIARGLRFNEMRSLLLMAPIGCLLVLSMSVTTQAQGGKPVGSRPMGDKPAAAPSKTADGGATAAAGPEIQQVDLAGLKELLQRDGNDKRPLLVNFWASWCDGCREEFPDLVKIDDDYRAKGLNFLSVTVDEIEDKRLAASFIAEMKARMPVVILNVPDKEPAIHAIDMNWDGALPATFLYDSTGNIVYRHFGKIKPEELRAIIDKQVKQ
jgi:thiol-disulfide isomerase/thioredoxin